MLSKDDLLQKISIFYDVIGVGFHNSDLVVEALTHRSFTNEHKEAENNERLEFLGDAVLELAVTEYLFNEYPKEPEGNLTSYRSALVKTESLAEEAERLGIGRFILMSLGEEQTGGRDRSYILANTVEAIIGAIYQEHGYMVAKKFIVHNICHKIKEIIKLQLYIDAKSKLQEITQEEVKITPSYEMVSESGPDHNKMFVMAVKIGDTVLASAEGKSKQIAEQNAARIAVEKWNELKAQINLV